MRGILKSQMENFDNGKAREVLEAFIKAKFKVRNKFKPFNK